MLLYLLAAVLYAISVVSGSLDDTMEVRLGRPDPSIVADYSNDVPDATATDGMRWAEFRINATTFRSYDTRYDARPGWARATNVTQAAATSCTGVGYALSVCTVSRAPNERVAVAPTQFVA